ncbi:MAG: extracellular solute-binding protein [Lachnospiraceae bacterium]|nr:extracellular solute-binding protein [Lachnospiraceae bacterium]
MKKKKWFKALALFLVSVLFAGGCGFGNEKEEECPYEEFIVVDVFDSLANFQGIQSGWFAKIVKDKFNMELNIIAPNVAGGGDTLYEIRSAAGDLGDLIIVGVDNGKLENLVTSGLLIDMQEYLKDQEIMQYETAIRELNNVVSEEGIYAIPAELSGNSPLTPSETSELTYGPYLRWDAYAALGYPEMETMEDLLPVLKDMQELVPTGDTGNPTYAFSLFKDWDGNLMNAAKQPACLYGYDEIGFVLAKADGSDYQSIIDENSLYMRALRFYFEANQLGLLDPDSPTQNYDSVFQKYVNGDILFSIWPWQGQSAYNTLSHKEEGKGFMLAPINDMEIFSYGCKVSGNPQVVVAIGSNAEDPERLADFINWLYSPEGIQINGAQASGGTAGPEGLTWEMTEDGPVLTEFGVQALMNGEVAVPEEWGGGLWGDGVSALNFKPVMQSDTDPNGYSYAYLLWDSVTSMETTALDKAWQEYMGAENTIEYLEQNNMMIIAPGCNYVTPTESSEITTMRSQCKNIIVEYSWKMIFAADEEEFNILYETMVTKLSSLGYEQVLAVDMQNAHDQNKARQKAVEKYGSQ